MDTTRTTTSERHSTPEPTSTATTPGPVQLTSRPLLHIGDLRALGFGRQLSYLLIDRLPHVCAGRRKLVSRMYLEDYLLRAAEAKCDLWDDLRSPTGIWCTRSDQIGVTK